MKLIDHMAFLFQVTDGTLQMTNQQDAEVFCSWKVGGQDFYAYGKAIKAEPAEGQSRKIRMTVELTLRDEPSHRDEQSREYAESALECENKNIALEFLKLTTLNEQICSFVENAELVSVDGECFRK